MKTVFEHFETPNNQTGVVIQNEDTSTTTYNLQVKNLLLVAISLNYMIGGLILAYNAATGATREDYYTRLLIVFFFGLYGWYLYRNTNVD